MYKDYIDQILLDYAQKKLAGTLSLNLKEPTPAQLRDECLIVCAERWDRKDEPTLRTFFGTSIDQKTYRHTIDNFDINKFKQPIKFLNNSPIDTNQKNIELLAWLINFEPRPFELWKKKNPEKQDKEDAIGLSPEKQEAEERIDPAVADTAYAVPAEDTGEADAPGPEATGTEDPVIKDPKPGAFSTILKSPATFKLHFKAITIPVAAVVLASAVVPVYQYIKAGFQHVPECMYWTGDHYQSIPCNQKIYGSLVIPLDTEKQVHFKKITRPDTITEADINRISYIRLNGNIEYYTRKGDHPVYTERTLNPLTEHIYQKHILPLKH
ncbi:hypothetical protein [Niabella sp.]|uniref:hypothetical protein n=1 Tax=Niabella sp. TaxID=1962976 RepID=UPI0026362CFA|nr:hypothetical protein [Niabella sp.]